MEPPWVLVSQSGSASHLEWVFDSPFGLALMRALVLIPRLALVSVSVLPLTVAGGIGKKRGL